MGPGLRDLIGLAQAGEAVVVPVRPLHDPTAAPAPAAWRGGRWWSLGRAHQGRMIWGPRVEIPGLVELADQLQAALAQAQGMTALWAVMPELQPADISVPPWHGEA
jgi:hypothetical protein